MKKLMTYFRRKIGVVSLEGRHEALTREVGKQLGDLNGRLKQIEKLVNLGVDVHLKKDESWAVVCISGEKPYVVFYRLGHGAEEIVKFLNDWKRAGGAIVIDTPPFAREYFR